MREPLRHPRLLVLLLITGDLLIAFGSYLLAFRLRSVTTFGGLAADLLPASRFDVVEHYLWVVGCLQVSLLYAFGLYDYFWRWPVWNVPRRVVAALFLEMTALVSFYYFVQNPNFPRSIFLLHGALNMLGVLLFRTVVRDRLRQRIGRRRVLIVGSGAEAREILNELRSFPGRQFEVVGVLNGHKPAPETSVEGAPVLGDKEDILSVVCAQQIDEVILAEPPSWQDHLVDELTRNNALGTRLSIVPSCFEILIGRMNHTLLKDIPLIQVLPEPASALELGAKRLFDVVLAAALLVTLAPVLLLVAAAVRVSSGSPVLYHQERTGYRGQAFEMLKFRTMRPDAEVASGPTLSSEGDARVTAIGRFLRRYRLDELPQLVNILGGEMSFVGPRPERPAFVERYLQEIPGYGQRLMVKPGLTGLAQVRGFYQTSPQNKLKHDLAYILNRSIFLDLRLIAETVKRIVTAGPSPEG
ncbi:MAG: sugar transferase [Candidatus Schekmanbacteria bacterium]|nr:sugar transferase [Candidatus Schekmanbacteria bacterium]